MTVLALSKIRRLVCLLSFFINPCEASLASDLQAAVHFSSSSEHLLLITRATMIAPIVTAAAFAALGAAEEVAWSGFDRWSYNSYSELGTKQADYYPEFFKNNVSSSSLQSSFGPCAHPCIFPVMQLRTCKLHECASTSIEHR